MASRKCNSGGNEGNDDDNNGGDGGGSEGNMVVMVEDSCVTSRVVVTKAEDGCEPSSDGKEIYDKGNSSRDYDDKWEEIDAAALDGGQVKVKKRKINHKLKCEFK